MEISSNDEGTRRAPLHFAPTTVAFVVKLMPVGAVRRSKPEAAQGLSRLVHAGARVQRDGIDSDLLVDGNIASNSGTWQWVAGTGNVTRPDRVFDPVRQARRFDRDSAYVRAGCGGRHGDRRSGPHAITNREGAAALRISPRQFQRLKERFRAGGAPALRHRGRGRLSHRRLPADQAVQVQALLSDRYKGFNDTHATETLQEIHHIAISRESVRRLRRALGRPAVHRRRPAQHRRRRPREQAAGQLVQLDGSPFDWLEGRGPAMTLLGAIDDATSQVVALHFRPTEDLHGYATVLRHMWTSIGLPVALYGDGVNILVRTDRHWTLDEQLAGRQAPTHLGRVLQELGIAYIQARSPQGKGRVERLWQTLQDRLVSELRLRGIATLADANAFLPEFMADFNRRFAQPAGAAPVWRRPPRDLDRVLSCRYQRVVARDNTVRLGPRLIQIPPGPHGRSYARRRVDVRELLDGRIVVLADARVIATVAAPGPEFALIARSSPVADRRPSRAQPSIRTALNHLAAALPRAPAALHPWRRPYNPSLAQRAARRPPQG